MVARDLPSVVGPRVAFAQARGVALLLPSEQRAAPHSPPQAPPASAARRMRLSSVVNLTDDVFVARMGSSPEVRLAVWRDVCVVIGMRLVAGDP